MTASTLAPLDAQVRRLLIEEAIEEHRRTMEGLRYRAKHGEKIDAAEPQAAHDILYNCMLEAIQE